MLWKKLSVIIFISTLIIECRIRIEVKTKCKNSQDITMLMMVEPDPKQFNILVLHLKEPCSNLTLVKLTEHKVITLIVLEPIDTSLGYWMDKSQQSNAEEKDLKEYLQVFSNGIQTSRRRKRTLVVFGMSLKQDIVNLLYKLQAENNFKVILVSNGFEDIMSLKQFPRHLKFLTSPDIFSQELQHHRLINLKQLIEVIKNPDFNRFKFEKHLPTFKNRNCLKNVSVIPVIPQEAPYQFSLLISNLIKDYICDNVTVQPLVNKIDEYIYNPDTEPRTYSLPFEPLYDYGTFDGPRHNIFILFFNKIYLQENSKLSSIEQHLKRRRQSVVKKTIHFDKWDYVLESSLIFKEGNYFEGFSFADHVVDLLVDATGCK